MGKNTYIATARTKTHQPANSSILAANGIDSGRFRRRAPGRLNMDRYPGDIHPDYPVATIYASDGQPYVYVRDHEPALPYAAPGHRVKVHMGDGPYSHQERQEAVDRELADAQSSESSRT
jgi:hypothetical protein